MAVYRATNPQTKISAEYGKALVKSFRLPQRTFAVNLLKNHGIEYSDNAEYYRLQNWLDALSEIESANGSVMLWLIGEKVAAAVSVPDDIITFQDFLGRIDEVYDRNLSQGPAGHYKCVELHDESTTYVRKLRIECSSPFPCAFDRGYIQGFANRLETHGCHDILVTHDDSQLCRRSGHESCSYQVAVCHDAALPSAQSKRQSGGVARKYW